MERRSYLYIHFTNEHYVAMTTASHVLFAVSFAARLRKTGYTYRHEILRIDWQRYWFDAYSHMDKLDQNPHC